jgi:hypothetical protein
MNPQDPHAASSDNQPPQHFSSTPPATAANAAPTPAPEPSAPAPPATPPEQSFYRPDGPTAPNSGAVPADSYREPATAPQPESHHYRGESATWTALEFLAHDKSSKWFAIFGGVSLAVTAIIFLITHDIFSTIIVAIIAIALGVTASRQPRQMQYAVDDQGITVGTHLHPYGNFRSFAIVEEETSRSIVFMPLKRFMPPLSIYYDPQQEERISEILAAHLPLQQHKLDAIEKLMRQIHF